MDPRHAVLAEHFLLQHLQSGERDAILRQARERSYAAGATIFQRGDEGTSVMAVLEGKVRIGVSSEAGREITLSIVPAGGLFGEIALIDGRGRTADAVALTAVRLIVLEQRHFLGFLEDHPRAAIRLLQVMCHRVRQSNQIAEGLVFLDLPGRLARLLLQLAEQHGEATAAGRRIGLKLSQTELAQLVAATRESVNKHLRAWTHQELIRVDKGVIRLLDEAALRSLAAGDD